jgi:DNA integrity scanning protein DisA with diadenylate cyclase activity
MYGHHGGTVLWCPSTQLAPVAKLQSGTQVTIATSGHALAARVLRQSEAAITDPDVGPPSSDSRCHLADDIEFVARLATVDGALIVDDEIVPHYFRSKLAAKPWSGRVVEADATGQHTKDFDVSGFGMRHTSALALVHQCPGVVAFVVSEDGPVRALMCIDEDVVVIWPDLYTGSLKRRRRSGRPGRR